ncbi:hypothetical protein F2Q65_05965 [Thiohalocapsa marina]|uniref:Uncharacterized protein n=1 Tax=Thiohalocapsa marina TaxID=424902 RepID=A0A5M8FN64_9GAMM|nr:hypothetical protein [Thiohalocapsa marina]KAA6186338.1 hypothetical protein F2Q65_05965 [Thiohalocapsa marina]
MNSPFDRMLADTSAAWRWPDYQSLLEGALPGGAPLEAGDPGRAPGGRLLALIRAACFIEWRYYSVLAPAFRGIVGLALVNPRGHAPSLTESGLLTIVAGVLPPIETADQAVTDPPAPVDSAVSPESLSWMHLFPTAACRFNQPDAGGLIAEDATCRLELRHDGAGGADLTLQVGLGPGLRPALKLELQHRGLTALANPPAAGRDLRRVPGGHWVVHTPSPAALTSGRLRLGPDLESALSAAVGDGAGAFASPSLLQRLRGQAQDTAAWRSANGYYEHSFGIHPLPFHGWDFLFVPDAERGQSLVMQTYRGSRQLRYVEVGWQQGGRPRRHRFNHHELQLTWPERIADPVLGVERPVRRRLIAEGRGLRLTLDAHVQHCIPLLRSARAAVRHFFICEEIGLANWTLTDASGQVLAAVVDQPCGGELAHRRWRVPAADPARS